MFSEQWLLCVVVSVQSTSIDIQPSRKGLGRHNLVFAVGHTLYRAGSERRKKAAGVSDRETMWMDDYKLVCTS